MTVRAELFAIVLLLIEMVAPAALPMPAPPLAVFPAINEFVTVKVPPAS